MKGRTIRMIIGFVVLAADLGVYVKEHILSHAAPVIGWQVAKDHLPYLILAYLLIDWSHAFGMVKTLKDKIPGLKQ